MQQEIESKVWQTHGIFGGSTPGLLSLAEGYISFITPDGVQFHEPLTEVKEVKWPFIRMGLGCSAVVRGKKYSISFGKPNAYAAELDDSTLTQVSRLTGVGRTVDSISTLGKLGSYRKIAKQWRAALGG
ncbi:MAG: hypothetical protein ABIX01_04615 [Chitinophagaceae bacterium]